MAIQAAQLVVSLTAQGAQQTEGAINRVSGAVDKAAGGFDAFFDSIQGGAGNALRALDGLSRVMGSIALVGGVTLLAGGARAAWAQVDAVQQATIALRAYEQDARAVDDVLNDLLRFARSDAGRLFMRQELFHAAQVLKVAGAETQNLSRYVEIMSRAVSTGMTTFNDLERVLARVVSTGRLTTVEFELLQQAGFMLDESLRNTTVTAEELFDALDRGSVEIAGQTETIQGRMMQLQTAIRGVGLALLDVDSETSMFREGGLGARIMEGLEAAPALLSSVADAARGLGNAIVGIIDFVANMVNWFRMWPDSIQGVVTAILKLVTAFGALRVAGRAMGMITGMMGLGGLTSGIGTLMGGGLFRGGVAGATGFGASLATLVTRINPVGLAITGLVAVGAGLVNSFMNNKAATEAWESSLMSLEDTLERLRRRGDSDLADYADEVRAAVMDPNRFGERLDMEAYFGERIKQDFGIEAWSGWLEGLWTMPQEYTQQVLQDFEEIENAYIEVFSRGSAEMTKFNQVLRDALSDPDIDAHAWLTDLMTLLETTPDVELADAFREFLDIPLSEWAYESADAIDAIGESARASVEDIRAIFADVPQLLSDLRIDGLHRQANEIEALSAAFQGMLITQESYWDDSDMTAAPILRFREIAAIAPESAAIVESSWQRISDALASGNFDNARLIADIMEVITSPDLDAEAKVREIEAISLALHEYLNVAQDVLSVLGQSDLTSMLDLAGLGGEAVSAAANINQLAASMDTLFRVVVGNTNAIGSQFEALFKWADELIAAEGVWSKLDDLLAAGRISGEHGVFSGDSEYARAQQAYNSILEDNAAIQEHILVIQARQAPLLAANASAMEEYMASVADMPIDEQLATLGFMDAGLQSQLGTVIDLAGQFSTMGAEGEAGFRAMAEGVMHTNPALFAMMETMGLIKAERDEITGEVLDFEINLDGATTVQDTLNDLIESIDALTVALGGVAPSAEAAMSALSSMGSTARDAMLAALPDRGAATHGDTGVPVVTGLPNTGSGGTMTIDADTSAAHTVLSLLEDRLDAMEARTTIAMIDADSSSAHNVLSLLEDRLDGYEASSYSATLSADSSVAHSVLTLLENRLDAFNGSVYTATLNVGVGFSGFNIPGFADGGVVNSPLALVGERGPELVSLPQGSYVHTNAETMRMMSGSGNNQAASKTTQVSVTFAGDFYGSNREELDEWADSHLVPAFVDAINDERRGQAR